MLGMHSRLSRRARVQPVTELCPPPVRTTIEFSPESIVPARTRPQGVCERNQKVRLMLPVVLDLRGRPVLVVGGGAVGRRKATALLDAGAAVTIVDPAPRPADFGGPAVWVREAYRATHLAGMRLVVAAARADVSARVVADAAASGIWINSASNPDAGNVAFPAVVRRGAFAVAVSTGGASPAFARRVRERLEAEFDESVAAFVSVLAEVRGTVLAAVPDPARRRELLDAFAGWDWLDRVRQDGAGATKAAMLAAVVSDRQAGPSG